MEASNNMPTLIRYIRNLEADDAPVFCLQYILLPPSGQKQMNADLRKVLEAGLATLFGYYDIVHFTHVTDYINSSTVLHYIFFKVQRG